MSETNSKVHDYRQCGWGHNAYLTHTNDGGRTGSMSGWGRFIEPGDFVVLANGDDFASYRVDRIKYNSNPPDQWHAQVTWVPGVFEVRGNSAGDTQIFRCKNGKKAYG